MGIILKVMNRKDPLGIIDSIQNYINHSKYVRINKERLAELLGQVKERIKKGLPEEGRECFVLHNYKKDIQLVFLINVVNYCFWSEKGREKWKVKFNDEEGDGHDALVIVFKKAIETGQPILDANYLSELSLGQIKTLFMSSNDAEIPLIETRHQNLKEAGEVLKNKFQGSFLNLIKESNFDAIKIVKNTVRNFKSFDDSVENKIIFYKRAQLNAYDISLINPKIKIKNTEKLTAMADYKLPQLLRHKKVLEYSKELSDKIDNLKLIEQNSQEEIEIRAATVWAVDLMSKKLNYPAGLIDRAIWWLSREENITQPYHRTYSTYY